MWDRQDLKRRALDVLRHTYWTVFIILLIYVAIITMSGSFTAGIVSVVVSCFGQVGLSRYLMRLRQGQSDLNDLLFGFQRQPGNVFITCILQGVFIALWSMLLVVPGVIKALEYSCIPFILAENPDLDQKRVFEISRLMTEGEKINIFVLWLSFAGWAILCILTFGVGFFFLYPYMSATYAELYAALRDKALYNGLVSRNELPGF